MGQHLNSFQRYDRLMKLDEVGGSNNPELVTKITLKIAAYLKLVVNPPEIQKVIFSGNYIKLKPYEQVLVRVAQSIAASQKGGPSVGLTRGQFQTLLKEIPDNIRDEHLGSEKDSVEALAILLGQLAAGKDAHITLEPGFQKQVVDFYKFHSNKTNNDRIAQAKLARSGMGSIARAVASTGLQDSTIKELKNTLSQLSQKLYASTKQEDKDDAYKLGEFIKGLG